MLGVKLRPHSDPAKSHIAIKEIVPIGENGVRNNGRTAAGLKLLDLYLENCLYIPEHGHHPESEQPFTLISYLLNQVVIIDHLGLTNISVHLGSRTARDE